MTLTENKFMPYKRDIYLYRRHEETDAYDNEYISYDLEPTTIPKVMLTPYQRPEAEIELYGEDDKNRYQFVYYGGLAIRQLDKIKDGDKTYQVAAVLNYQTHRIIELEELL